MKHPRTIYMQRAILEAKRATRIGQYPLGAIVVQGKKIISVAHTTLHKDNDPSAHAEMRAIRTAVKKKKSRYLQGVWLYTTQEPCPMCTSLAIFAKMEGIVFGASKDDALKIYRKNKDGKFTWRQINLSAEEIIKKGEPRLKLVKKFLRKECLELYDWYDKYKKSHGQ